MRTLWLICWVVLVARRSLGRSESLRKRVLTDHRNETHVRWTIEGRTDPSFLCPECISTLEEEQTFLIQELQSRFPGTSVLAQLSKLANLIFLVVPLSYHDQVAIFTATLNATAKPSEVYFPQVDESIDYLEVFQARERYCVTGKGVKVAILDTGIDYTHSAIGGSGIPLLYRQAYGTEPSSNENKRRDGLFPTARVVEGYDFIGEFFGTGSFAFDAVEDDDPIDGPSVGHGTAVADAVLSVAPEAELVAVKVCSSQTDFSQVACPDFAILLGLEYVLDIDRNPSNGNTPVDIVNLSLGSFYASSYYDTVSRVLEGLVARANILPIVAQGNYGNEPYISGALAGSPNIFSVGATTSVEESMPGVMARFSSRGPGFNNIIKPDISAPGGRYPLAKSGTGTRTSNTRGTSFAAPIIAGASALIKEKCPSCSPFAIKSILMNTASRSVRYDPNDTTLAPVTWVGSGELQISKALGTEVWAYNIDDTQPSFPLGLIEVTEDFVMQRTVRIKNLSNRMQSINLSARFRDPLDQALGAFSISFERNDFLLPGGCGSEVDVIVKFHVNATLTPANKVSKGGRNGVSTNGFDTNEFDGWIVIEHSGPTEDVSLPFHSILRRSADVHVGSSTLTLQQGSATQDVNVGIVNRGAGVAQIDTYELLHASEDDPEGGWGSDEFPADIRYVGYRTIPVNRRGCTHLVEFAIQSWESFRTPNLKVFEIRVDVSGNGFSDFSLFNMGKFFGTENNECRVYDEARREWSCANFPVDHTSNSGNIVLRACSEDLGLNFAGVYTVAVYTSTPSGPVDSTGRLTIRFPTAALSAPSYDVLPGARLDTIRVTGNGQYPAGGVSKGLLFMTNSYRSSESTGSSTRATEAIAIPTLGVALPREKTLDKLEIPKATNLEGPGCQWTAALSCSKRSLRRDRLLVDASEDYQTSRSVGGDSDDAPINLDYGLQFSDPIFEAAASLGTCPEVDVPRLEATTIFAAQATPSPTVGPTISPSPTSFSATTDSPTTGSGVIVGDLSNPTFPEVLASSSSCALFVSFPVATISVPVVVAAFLLIL